MDNTLIASNVTSGQGGLGVIGSGRVSSNANLVLSDADFLLSGS